jgi:RND family efflux transporter MFP subunit
MTSRGVLAEDDTRRRHFAADTIGFRRSDFTSTEAPRPRMRGRRVGRVALIVPVLLGVVAGGGYLLSSREPDHTSIAGRAPALTVSTATSRQVVWPATLTASGSIEAWQEASVGTQVGGYQLVEVRVNVGDQVRRGDVLARLDPALLRAEEARLVAENEQAQANRQRALTLQGKGAISDRDVLQNVTAADVAEAQLAFNRLQLHYTEVVAPDDGVISARTATLGAVAPAGQELFRLIRGGRLEWRGELTAAQLASVVKGQLVNLALPDGSSAEARVRDTAPSLDARTRLGIVYADLLPASKARAGMYANGQVVVAETAALAVPAESIVIRDGRSYIATLAAQTGTPAVTLQLVVTGRRRDDEVEIVSGLDGHETIVRTGAGFLNDGDIVRIADTEPNAPVATSSREAGR